MAGSSWRQNGSRQQRPVRSRRAKRIKSRASWRDELRGPLAVSCAWTSDDTFALSMRAYESASLVELELTFEPSKLRIRERRKYGFGPLGPFDLAAHPR